MDADRRQAITLRLDWDCKAAWGKLNPQARAKTVIGWIQRHNVFAHGYIPTPAELYRAVQVMYGTGMVEPSCYLSLAFVLRSAYLSD